jgi:hypothetical protein
MADRWADLAAVSWRRELEFFADVGEVVVEGDLGEIAWAEALPFYSKSVGAHVSRVFWWFREPLSVRPTT